MGDLLPMAIIGGGIALSTGTTVAVASGFSLGEWHWKKHGCKRNRVLFSNISNLSGKLLNRLNFMMKSKDINSSSTYTIMDEKGSILTVPFSKFWLKTYGGTNIAVYPIISGGYLIGYDFWTYIWFGTTYRQDKAFEDMNRYIQDSLFRRPRND